MKVLGIMGSPRRDGNTENLVQEALDSARELESEVELVPIADKNIAPCDGCESCMVTKKCKIEDDMQEIYSKLLEADGIIFGTPVYFWGVSAQIKALIDRTFLFRGSWPLRGKTAGIVVVARRRGVTQAFGALLNYFNLQGMIPAGGATVYADKKGDVRQDSVGIAEARELGRNIVKAIQRYEGSKSA